MAQGEVKQVGAHTFHGFGSHTDTYSCVYLTAAAAIGMSKHDVDLFVKKLHKVLGKMSTMKSPQAAMLTTQPDEEK